MSDIASFEIDAVSGFLPPQDPLSKLPAGFERLEELAQELSKLFATDQLRARVERMPLVDISQLGRAEELERAMLLLSYLGHGYVWSGAKPPVQLPKPLALPWYETAKRLGRPPVLSYASYALHNWKRLDPSRDIELGNIALLQNFLGGIDEEWFILVHVDIERKAGPAIAALLGGQQAVKAGDLRLVEATLTLLATRLEQMHEVLARMPEHCDPYIYYNRVRPYINGWKANPAIPNGLLYDGVEEWRDQPQQFRGETGAQSTIIPSFDAFLGIVQEDDPLKKHLNEMRLYMPPKHRAFLETLEQGPKLRELIKANLTTHPSLRDVYNSCVTWIDRFRQMHLGYAGAYIDRQKQTNEGNPTKIGTGGTPFMQYLKKHQVGTASHLL